MRLMIGPLSLVNWGIVATRKFPHMLKLNIVGWMFQLLWPIYELDSPSITVRRLILLVFCLFVMFYLFIFIYSICVAIPHAIQFILQIAFTFFFVAMFSLIPLS